MSSAESLEIRSTLLLIIFLVILSAGCVSMGTGDGNENPASVETILNTAPKISLFINLKNADGPNLSAQLGDIELFDGDKWISVSGKPVWIEAKAIGNGQKLLSRANAPAGNYTKIRYTVTSATIHEGENEVLLQEIKQAEPQPLSPSLEIEEGDSTSVFLVWDTGASLGDEGLVFNAGLQAAVQTIPLTTELAYVSCPDIDTIYIVRTDKNWVSGSWGVSGNPSHLSVFKENNELFVLAEKELAIKVIELSSGRLKDTVKIPMVIKPFFMVADLNGSNIFILDKSANHVFKVDMASGTLAGQTLLDERLGHMVYLADRRQLAVTSLISQKVYILDASNMNILETVSIGSRPHGMLYFNNKLYLTESASGTVVSYDLNNSRIEKTQVGREPQQFIEQDDYIYVSNYGSGTVSVLLPDQFSVLKNIRVGGAPARMGASSLRNWIYVIDAKENRIAVVDSQSHRVDASLEFKTRLFDVDVIR